MKLAPQIRDLLYQYDCVIVPGLGGFLCSFNPARIHPVQHRFYPPSKKISFNAMLTMNDGLLAHSISVASGTSYKTALETIEEEVRKWKNDLREKGQINLDKIGTLIQDVSGNLQFEPEEKENYLRASYGLTEFQVIPVDRPKVIQMPVQERDMAATSDKSSPVLLKSLRYSAAAAVLTIAVLAGIKLNIIPDQTLSQISLNPFKSEKGVYSPVRHEKLEGHFRIENNDTAGWPEDKKTYEATEGPLKGIIFEINEQPVSELISNPTKTDGPYHVVGGCFSILSNAEKLSQKLRKKGYDAGMRGTYNGLHVVAYGSFSNELEARALLDKIRENDNAAAWVLKKNN